MLRHWSAEHGVGALDGRLLSFRAGGGRHVGQSDHVEPLLVRGPHRRLDTAVGQKTTWKKVNFTYVFYVVCSLINPVYVNQNHVLLHL